MDDKMTKELIAETTMDDISENYKPIVNIIGIEKFVELSDYARGDELYFPKVETIVSPARNRRIKVEYNGYNVKDLAEKYNLTIQQITRILKDVPHPGQVDIFEWQRDKEETLPESIFGKCIP